MEEEKLTHRSVVNETRNYVRDVKRTIAEKVKRKDELKESLMRTEDICSKVVEAIKELQVKIYSWDLVSCQNFGLHQKFWALAGNEMTNVIHWTKRKIYKIL